MTYEHFKHHWQEECFKDGVLTIPDGIDELHEDCCIVGNLDVYKVVLPQSGVEIYGPVFQECANLVSIENFPCVFKESCEIVDEDTGEFVSLEYERQMSVDEDAFKGCFNLFKDQQSIDEYGYVRLTIAEKVYPIGYVKNARCSFSKEMTALIEEMYDDSGIGEKQDFSFCKTICRYGNDYEYLFENGALYNKTNGTWVLFLPEYSNLHIVIPEWVRDIYFDDFLLYRQLGCIKSMRFLGETDLEAISDEYLAELESLELSDKNTAIRSEAFCHCPKLKTVTFGNPESILEKRAKYNK